MTRPITTSLLLAALLLGGCDRIGNPLEAIGRRAPAPDEFAVIKRKPLIIPPTAGLPEPRPGAPSPLDPTPGRDAEMALLGTASATAAAQASSGEAALLQNAGTAAATTAVATAPAAPREEYQPPSVLELLGLEDGSGLDDAEKLDPVAEAQRLQRQGVAAPSNPNAVPPVEAPAEEEPARQGVLMLPPPRANLP